MDSIAKYKYLTRVIRRHLISKTFCCRLGSTVNDSGIYSCYVKNKAGEINRKINVTILSEYWSHVAFFYTFSNYRAVRINEDKIWLFQSFGWVLWYSYMKLSKLWILNIVCRKTVNFFSSDSPTIKESWSNYREVIQGSSVELPCQALGDSKLTYSWDVEGRPIYDSSKW